MDTGASSHLNSSVTSLNTVFNTCIYPSISVGDGHSIPVTNTGHSILPTPTKSLHLNNVLNTPHIVKNLIYVRQFIHDNNCTIEFDAFSFFVKDLLMRRVLLRCDSTGDLYPVTAPSPIPHAFLLATGLSMLAGAAVVKSVMDQYNMMGPGFDRFPKCARCNGSGRVSCLCNRWSDGDRGCGACDGSGRMVCSICRGGGTGHPLPVQILVRPPNQPY
ncbi:hypothetical protein Tco_1029220 [Tanacetum coccineum]|uniref:Retrovirus-related Pol polyprotein from transposon TNT 1-94-like beta-barrel domain-containing protein n=1 Tax=Tanacetum coccineum TaxID=301880 RepID=A0ABQ5G4D3_9ASTR